MKDIPIDLKGYALDADAKVKVMLGDVVICDYTVPKGTWQIILAEQVANGLQKYEVTVNNTHTWTEEVIFPDKPTEPDSTTETTGPDTTVS